MNLLIFIFILIVFILGYKLIYEQIYYWDKMGIPNVKPFPVLGNMVPSILGKKAIAHIQQELYNKFSNHRYFGYFFFNTPCLMIRDPELVKQICIKDFDAFSDHREFLPQKADPFWNKILFARKGSDWREFRRIINPAFSQSKMKHMFVFITECTKRLLNSIPDGQEMMSIEMQDLITKFNNDLVVNAVFGLECNSFENPGNEFYKMGTSTFLLDSLQGLKFFGAAISPLFATLFKISFFGERAKNFYRSIIDKTLDYRDKNNITRIDLLYLLKEAQKGGLKYENNDKKSSQEFSVPEESPEEEINSCARLIITDDDVTVQIMGAFMTNYDSVTAFMCNTVYEITINTDIQERLISEVDATWAKCNGKLTYDDLLNMKYLDMVCSESIRLRSPTVFLDRTVTKSYTIHPILSHEKPLHLKPGQGITIPSYCFLRDPHFYPDPDKFDPERFSDEKKHSIQPQTFLSFGIGPRSCMGSRWALLHTKSLLFYLLLRFRFVPIDKSPIPFILDTRNISQVSKNGYWIGLKSRVI